MSDEDKRAHLAMIQAVVTRLATNSFQMKGWAVVLVSGLFGLASASTKYDFAFVAYLPAVAFWLLDAYYLRQERLFRKLYDGVRVKKPEDIDFSMNTMPFVDAVAPVWRVALSQTLAWFYGPMLATVAIVSTALNV